MSLCMLNTLDRYMLDIILDEIISVNRITSYAVRLFVSYNLLTAVVQVIQKIFWPNIDVIYNTVTFYVCKQTRIILIYIKLASIIFFSLTFVLAYSDKKKGQLNYLS